MENNDIVLAYISFAQTTGGKQRPVLIRQLKSDHVLILPITSKYDNKSAKIKRQYYRITNWAEAGLSKQSYVDILGGRDLPIDGRINFKEIGQMTNEDLNGLAQFIEQYRV
jgi:hypothetical protein